MIGWKLRPLFVYHGFGFPVLLEQVPVTRIRGAWAPNVDPNELARRVLLELVQKGSRLSGSEVRFVRHSFRMTLKRFARRFGVTHPAVMKWERRGGLPSNMSWSTEKDLRLEIFSRNGFASASKFLERYFRLSKAPDRRHAPIRVRF